jgi:hypothetical protein
VEPNVYWRDARLTTLADDALVELAGQLEALTRNARVQENPECFAAVAKRYGDCLAEIDARIGQLTLL